MVKLYQEWGLTRCLSRENTPPSAHETLHSRRCGEFFSGPEIYLQFLSRHLRICCSYFNLEVKPVFSLRLLPRHKALFRPVRQHSVGIWKEIILNPFGITKMIGSRILLFYPVLFILVVFGIGLPHNFWKTCQDLNTVCRPNSTRSLSRMQTATVTDNMISWSNKSKITKASFF